MMAVLFDDNLVADNPQFQLFQAAFPASFELLHPLPIGNSVRDINDHAGQYVAEFDAAMAPMALHASVIETDGAKLRGDLICCLSEPLSRHGASVVEPYGQQDFESSPPVLHG